MSLYVRLRNGMGSITVTGVSATMTGADESDFMGYANDTLQAPGVVPNVSATDGFQVTQNSPLGMSVLVQKGTAYVLNSAWVANNSLTKFWSIESDVQAAVVIPTAPGANSRIDAICLKVDTTAAPDGTASNVATLVCVTGTAAASPTPPATPSNYLLLAHVTVGTSVTTIANAVIADRRSFIGVDSANGSWSPIAEALTFGAADDPTYTMTLTGDWTLKYAIGQRIKVTQVTGGTKYFIITNVAFASTTTTITLFGGTDYDLNNEAIYMPYYSAAKAPRGFPMNPTKWAVKVTDATTRTQGTPSNDTWYNASGSAGQITVPIGAWRLRYACLVRAAHSSGSTNTAYATLGTAAATEDDKEFTSLHNSNVGGNDIQASFAAEKLVVLTSKQIYYMNIKGALVNFSLQIVNASKTMVLEAVSAYL